MIKKYKKIIIGAGVGLVIVMLLHLGINLWVQHKLPVIINQNNDSPYFITYKSLNVSLLTRTIHADSIVVVPKLSLQDTVIKKGIYASVKSIEIESIEVFSLIFGNKLKATTIAIETPEITIYSKEQQHSVKNSVVAPFEKIIKVSNIKLANGSIQMMSKDEAVPILSASNIHFNVEGIVITNKILDKKIPLEYENYTLTCDSLFYHPNSFYNLKTRKIKVTKNSVVVDDLEVLPTFTRREFVAQLPKEKDIYTVLCKTVQLKNSDWGFNKDDFFFHCKNITLDEVNANVYRSKVPDDDTTKKDLYNKLLRDLNFDLKIDTLQLKNSKLVYEEEKSFEVGAGTLRFDQFNLTATAVNSGFKRKSLPDVNIAIQCRFMNKSPFDVIWSFNVLDKSDGFNIQGKIRNFETEQINAFTKPYLNLTTKGILDEVRFNFTGNDINSKGQLSLKYDNLEVTVFQKDKRKQKSKFLSFIANIFVKDDSEEQVKEAIVEVNRMQEKSFYNYLWLNIADGLKQIMI